MERQPVYIVRDTLEAFCGDPRVTDFRLSTFRGRGRLDLYLREGCMPGLSTGRESGDVVLLFSPFGAALHATGADGQPLVFAAGDEDEEAGDLVNAPLAWLAGRRRAPMEPVDEAGPPTPSRMPGINRAALQLLMRHVSVTDLVFGSDGQECSLQFRLRDGYAGICANPPMDWVGIDFDDDSVDLGWFDSQGSFRMSSFGRLEHGIEIDRLFADPLGHVLKGDNGDTDGLPDTGMRAMLHKLYQDLGSTPVGS